MLKPICALSALSLSMSLLAGCSPSNPNDSFKAVSSSSSSSGAATSSGSSSGALNTPAYALGYLDSTGNFHAGQILFGATTLDQGAATTASVAVVDTANGDTPYVTSVLQVNFSSPCVTAKTSTVTTPINTNSGAVSATYTAQGCSGNDPVTASVSIGSSSSTLTATSQISVTPSDYVMGYVDLNGTFHPGQLLIGTSPLSAGGTSTVQADIVDENAAFAHYTVTPVTVNFTSPCAAAGTSTITSPVSNQTGTYVTSYVADGCGGSDLITASATLPGGQAVQASAPIQVQSPVLGQLTFVSVSPTNLGLQGTGGPGTSVVIFKLVNQGGAAVAGQTVSFSLKGAGTGTGLSTSQGTTATDGTVRATVNAGSQHSIVTVVASVTDASTGASLTSQSTPITISTGIPTSSNVSLAIGGNGCQNVEMLNYDGVNTTLQIRATDRYEYPVPDGTAIFFATESGTVTPSCTTTGGSCSVTFTSQNPRPDGSDGGIPGRSVVLASVAGEESFQDENGSGVFAAGDPFAQIPELWLDYNENGVRDSFEPFLDYNNNGQYDAAPSTFTGLLCNDPTICTSATSPGNELNVGQSVILVWSGSVPQLTQVETDLPSGASFQNGIFTFPAGTASGAQVAFILLDVNGQPLPAGTTVSLSASGSVAPIVAAPLSLTTPCTGSSAKSVNAYPFSFSIPASAAGSQGALSLSVQTPKSGQGTFFSFGINVK